MSYINAFHDAGRVVNERRGAADAPGLTSVSGLPIELTGEPPDASARTPRVIRSGVRRFPGFPNDDFWEVEATDPPPGGPRGGGGGDC